MHINNYKIGLRQWFGSSISFAEYVATIINIFLVNFAAFCHLFACMLCKYFFIFIVKSLSS